VSPVLMRTVRRSAIAGGKVFYAILTHAREAASASGAARRYKVVSRLVFQQVMA